MIAGRPTSSVRAVRAPETGGPEVLTVEQVELPDLTPGSVRVQVTRAGINFWDLMQRRGEVPLAPPSILGVEGAGTVVEVAAADDEPLLGRRVAWSQVPGSYAEQVQSEAWRFVPLPNGVTETVAAAVLMQGVTAANLLEAAPLLPAGSTVLVYAAAGGVGTLLIQLLVDAGVRVVGVVGSEDKRETAIRAGAETVVVDGEGLIDDVHEAAPDGVDVVFDGNGGPGTVRAFEFLAPRGALILFGTAAGPLPSIDLGLLARGSFTVVRVAGRHFVGTPDAWRAKAGRVLAAASDGVLRPVVGATASLEDAASLHRSMEERRSRGKLLLAPGNQEAEDDPDPQSLRYGGQTSR